MHLPDIVRWVSHVAGGSILLLVGVLLWAIFRFGITTARAKLAAFFAKGAVFSLVGSKDDVAFQKFILVVIVLLFVIATRLILLGSLEVIHWR